MHSCMIYYVQECNKYDEGGITLRNYKNPELHKKIPDTKPNPYPENVLMKKNLFAEGIKNIRVDKSGYLEIVPNPKKL